MAKKAAKVAKPLTEAQQEKLQDRKKLKNNLDALDAASTPFEKAVAYLLKYLVKHLVLGR